MDAHPRQPRTKPRTMAQGLHTAPRPPHPHMTAFNVNSANSSPSGSGTSAGGGVYAMECKNCETMQRRFYCAGCLCGHIHTFRNNMAVITDERDSKVKAATAALPGLHEARGRRAEVARLEGRVDEVRRHLGVIREASSTLKEKITRLQGEFKKRREMLAEARAGEVFNGLQRVMGANISMSTTITQAKAQIPVRADGVTMPVLPGSLPSRPSQTQQTSQGTINHQNPGPPQAPPLHASASQHLPISLPPHHIQLQQALQAARSGLVQELVEVFNIVEVGGRPPLGGKAGTQGEWTIGGLVLPVPGDVRRYPPAQMNAVITHTLHFISLLTFYLGVKLPFEVTWSGGKLGVGEPYIAASRGGEAGGWAKWHTKNPLHLPLSPASPKATSPTSSAPGSPSTTQPSTSPFGIADSVTDFADPQQPAPPIARRASTSVVGTARGTKMTGEQARLQSQLESHAQAIAAAHSTSAQPTSRAHTSTPTSAPPPPSSFTTALTMLLYNVSYLAYTQSVDVPLAGAGAALRTLWAVCCSPDLGRRSHETQPLLPPPTPVGFGMDFGQLVQAIAAGPKTVVGKGGIGKGRRGTGTVVSAAARGVSVNPGRISEEEWDLVDENEAF